MDKIKPIATVAIGVILAGVVLYFLGNAPVIKQARMGLTGSGS